MVNSVKSPFAKAAAPAANSLSGGSRKSIATGPDAEKKQNIMKDMMQRLGKNITPSSNSSLPQGAGSQLDVKG